MGPHRYLRVETALNRGRAAIILSLVSVLCLILLNGGCGSSRPGTPRNTIRVMTYNIHHAEGVDGRVDLERISDVILKAKADVVALQEVDRGVERTKKIDMMMELSDLTGMTYAFGKTIDFQGGDFGNGFLTRFPILEERNLLYSTIRGGEQRGLLQLVLEARGEEFVVMNTHLDYQEVDSERVACIYEIRAAAQRYSPRAVIVCGDFNDEPGSRALMFLKEEFLDTWEEAGRGTGTTYPADSARRRIDYIFLAKAAGEGPAARRAMFHPRSAQLLSSLASDHLPLLVEFETTRSR